MRRAPRSGADRGAAVRETLSAATQAPQAMKPPGSHSRPTNRAQSSGWAPATTTSRRTSTLCSPPRPSRPGLGWRLASLIYRPNGSTL